MKTTVSVIRRRVLFGLAPALCVCLWLTVAATGIAEARGDANTARLQRQTAQQGRNLGELLRPDGTLDLRSGYRGALNPEGYRLASGLGEQPRFEVEATPGDERWSDAFGLPGTDGIVYAIALDGNGNLYAGGYFTIAGGVPARNIAKWDGTSWQSLGSGIGSGMNDWVWVLVVDGDGNLYAGGSFTTAGGMAANHVAKWDGIAWSALGIGMNGYVYSLASDGSGNLYAGGSFTTAGGIAANHIAKWDGTAWSPLSSGMNGNWVNAFAVDGSGNLYAGGSFTTAGGIAANHIAKWDGSAWSPLGGGMNDLVGSLAVDGSGILYAGGLFTSAGGVDAYHIAKWDGTSWSPLGSGMNNAYNNAYVAALAVDESGNLYAGGNFTTAGGVAVKHIARWDGAAWSPLGSGMNGNWVNALAVGGSGNLYAGGDFTSAGGIGANYLVQPGASP